MSHKMLFMRYDAYDMHVFRQLKVQDKLRMEESSFSVAVIDSKFKKSRRLTTPLTRTSTTTDRISRDVINGDDVINLLPFN